MVSPYYVSPEQMMNDKAEFAQSGIAKARSSIVMLYNSGILMIADNPSSSLFKLSEIYDTIGFAGAGKYNEFESLRKAGIRHADLKGYSYSRDDVTAKELANNYSQLLGTVFSQDSKPYEVGILVVGLGNRQDEDEIFRISFDGSIIDEHGYAVIGGEEKPILEHLKDNYNGELSLAGALSVAKMALEIESESVPDRNLEVGTLDRSRSGRKFTRLSYDEIKSLLEDADK